MQSLSSNILSHLPFSPLNHRTSPLNSNSLSSSSSSSSLFESVTVPFFLPSSSSYSSLHSPINKDQSDSSSSSASSTIRSSRSLSSGGVSAEQGLGSSSRSSPKGGPAFVGQVFSMLDPSGNGLMAVTSHFDIPFLSKRTPEWMKKMLSAVTKRERNAPVFRFFMDLSDAVAYVKRLNIPTGMVGACRLDVAYQHFKEEPHMFQFVPSEKQVKAANRLLSEIPRRGRRRKIDGVPVFTAQNLNIAIATNDGIKWYIPYFFDKKLLDNILEASVDQHFHSLIQMRHTQRRRDVVDDSMTAAVEDNGDSLFEPPEVQEVLDELGHSGIPLSVISKAAEIQLLDVVDKVLLGNKWLRRASGIQPKFPYVVDSFEERTAASFPKASAVTSSCLKSEDGKNSEAELQHSSPELNQDQSVQGAQSHPIPHSGFQFPFGEWLSNPWTRLHENANTRFAGSDGDNTEKVPANPLLPKVTMVGISMGETGQMSRANLKKTMEDLTNELEESSQKSRKSSEGSDPLFVANVGDYASITRMNST